MSFSPDNLRDLNPWADPWWADVAKAGADEIERLRDVLAKHQIEVGLLRHQTKHLSRILAESARLREVLESIGRGYCICNSAGDARAALAEQERET